MIYADLTADERDALQRRPEQSARYDATADAVWQRIREQAEAEGLLTKRRDFRDLVRRRRSSRRRWCMAVLIVPRIGSSRQSCGPTADTPYVTARQKRWQQAPDQRSAGPAGSSSARLEHNLRSQCRASRVSFARAQQATILELEDRIAAIDYQLSDPEEQADSGRNRKSSGANASG